MHREHHNYLHHYGKKNSEKHELDNLVGNTIVNKMVAGSRNFRVLIHFYLRHMLWNKGF